MKYWSAKDEMVYALTFRWKKGGLVNVVGQLSNALSVFLAGYGLLAIFGVMLIKELGVPVPIPSDLIMITAGVQAAAGAYSLIALILLLLLSMLIGGSIQFFIARKAGRELLYRLGGLVGLTAERLDRSGESLRRRGPLAVFLGLNLSGARAGIIPAAGLAGMSYPSFTLAMVSGSGLFYAWHIALGYIAGPTAATLLERLHLPVGPVLLGLALLGLVGWLFLRSRRKRGAEAERATVDSLHTWTEAACPACLAISLLQRGESGLVAESA